MIKIDFKKTEYLEKEITQEGIDRWNKERKRIIKRLTPSIAITILTGIADAVLLVVMSFLLQYFIDGIQQTGKIEVPLLIALVSLVILLAVINYYNSYLSQVLQIKGLRLVSSYTYNNALHNDEFVKKVKSGDIVRLVSADSEAIGQRLGLRISMLSDGVLQTVIVLGIIFYFSWIVGIAVVIFYPLYFFLSDLVNKKLEKCYYENAKDFANVSHVRLKGIQGWLELAILKKRAFYAEKYNDSFEKAKKSLLKTCKWKAVLMMLSISAGYYIPVISVIVCTLPILFGTAVNVSSMLIVYMLAGYLINPLNSFTYAFQMYSEDKALYKRMSDLLFINPEEGNEGEDVGEIKDIDIQIDDYSYGGDELLLKNCRLHAERGDVVSVTGDSGCGKSTLFKLLVKQNPYELLHGSIQFNGKPVQSLSKDKLYDEMQYVSQNYFVFEDTLYNNLCMGDEFSKEQIDNAIDICCLNEFVAKYGLDMVMEENGKNISQGQLQRVCIARSLLREPRCLLLDEPTSALDKATGDKLMENIARYTKERGAITFVISHKDDAISRANKSIQLAK